MVFDTSSASSFSIASKWLEEVNVTSTSGDVDGFVNLFLQDGWLRDILCFSWDFRSIEGSKKIATFLSQMVGNKTRLRKAGLHNFLIETNSSLGPPSFHQLPLGRGIQGSFTFSVTSPPALGRGFFRLFLDKSGQWKAYTMFINIIDLIGYEEPKGRPEEFYSLRTWNELQSDRFAAIENDPTVVIIGCGQAGAMVAAAMGRLGIRVLVVEQTERVGDVWRNRYPNLTLNSSVNLSNFLYHPWPKTYPRWIPKDVYADFLEAYVVGQGIHVWLSSTVFSMPTYSPVTRRWMVHIDRMGRTITLNPKHIVVATGNGIANIPRFRGTENFTGQIYHSNDHRGAAPFCGKKALVIGAGNAGADICRDFVVKGASEVTVVQRTATAYITRPTAHNLVYTAVYPDNRNIEDGDLVDLSMPLPLVLRNLASGFGAKLQAVDRKILSGLEKAGYKTSYQVTPETGDTGYFGATILREGSGQLVDPVPGFGTFVIEGKVKVKHGVEVSHFESDGVVFEDGSKIVADVVVLATGNKPMIDGLRKFLGEPIIASIGSKVYGLDDDGELVNCFRPTGHPGLWFALGTTHHPRIHAKHLAIQILAEEVGMKKTHSVTSRL